MSAALPYRYSIDGRATTRARLPCSPKYFEMVLVCAFPFLNGREIVLSLAQGCAGVFQSTAQHKPNGAKQGFDLFISHLVSGFLGMNPGRP